MAINHPEKFRSDLKEFQEMTEKFYRKELTIPQYKHFSGKFGSYAQRGGSRSMLRLRLTGGEITREILSFLADSIEKYNISLAHLTTCQSLQLHNLNEAQVCALIEEAFGHGIITLGGGGDYPRNVMASPLSGLLPGEPFDVLPYAKEAADYLVGLIKTVRLPRKLKVCFSNSPTDEVHAAFRDLGFVAKRDGTFDVYCAGGLGRAPRMGIKAASGVAPGQILYHIQAMIDTFTAYGNYQNRARARTRFLQEDPGPDVLLAAYQKHLSAAQNAGGLDLPEALSAPDANPPADLKNPHRRPPEGSYSLEETLGGPKSTEEQSFRLIPQKQTGRYSVLYKPAGGNVPVEQFRRLSNALADMPEVSLRIAPTQCLYIVNCTEQEAQKILRLTPDSAKSHFELSMACIGAGICQVGARDSQATLAACFEALGPCHFPEGTLPLLRISGCPSSCCAHQVAALGFRGGVCQTPDGPKPAYAVYAGGCDLWGRARFAEELGVIQEKRIPDFLRELGKAIAAEGSTYRQWTAENPESFRKIVANYVEKTGPSGAQIGGQKP